MRWIPALVLLVPWCFGAASVAAVEVRPTDSPVVAPTVELDRDHSGNQPVKPVPKPGMTATQPRPATCGKNHRHHEFCRPRIQTQTGKAPIAIGPTQIVDLGIDPVTGIHRTEARPAKR